MSFCATRTCFILFFIFTIVALLSYCGAPVDPMSLGENDFAPRDACMKCHQDLSTNFAQTAHFHTSAAFNESILDSSFKEPTFYFPGDLSVSVEKRGGRYVQTARDSIRETESKPFDVVFGSGEKAMTFAWYADTGLYQLPLTYYTKIQRWVNSPGFPKTPHYKRAIISGCLECHSSYVKTVRKQEGPLAYTDHVVKGSILFGIDCQRCHGPAARHVAFHQTNEGVKPGRFITAISKLSRQQRLDNCAVCHSGSDETTIKSLFGFAPGDTLKKFYAPNAKTTEPDVHGNQYQMLARSACFLKSELDCSSCHDPHRTERNSPALFSQRCVNCHQSVKHISLKITARVANANCIDCHMPLQASKLISFHDSGKLKTIPYQLRNHQIGIYKDKEAEILTYLRSL